MTRTWKRALRRLPKSPLFFTTSSLLLMGIAPADGCSSEGDDQDGDGYSTDSGDCNDLDPSINPAMPEICDDGIDNNCDGVEAVCATLFFSSPTGGQVTNPVTFAVSATGISSVRYVADGQWILGESADAASGYAVTYTFSSYGPRSIEAQGFDSAGLAVASAHLAIDVLEPPSADQACYLGKSRDYSVCYEVVPLGSPPPSGYSYSSSCEASYGANYRAPDQVLDLNLLNPDDYIAPNFQLDEVAQASKGRYAVVQSHAIDHLQGIRDTLGPITITSGYRSPSYNASIGGASCSRHVYGDAFDMYASSAPLSAVSDACYDQGADYVDLYEDGHIHCDWRWATLDPAFYGSSARLSGEVEELRSVVLRPEEGGWTAAARGWDEGEPLRVWTAYDARGGVLEQATGRFFVPPAGTVELEVVVGGWYTARTRLTH